MSERALYLRAKGVFKGLGSRGKVGLCQLPLAFIVAAVALAAPAAWPGLLDNPLFLLGLLFHAVLLALCFLVPWDKLPVGSYVAIPLLDFAAVALSRNGAADILPGIGVLVIFPVIWISASGIYPRLSATVCFVGPFLVIAPPLGTAAPQQLVTALLFALMMLAVSVSLRFANLNTAHSRRKLAAREAEVHRLVDENNERERLLETILDTIEVGLVAVDATGQTVLTNRQQHSFDGLVVSTLPSADPGHFAYSTDKTTPVPASRMPLSRARAGETFSNYVVWLGPEGQQRAVSTAAGPMTDGDGRFAGAVIVYNDVTDMVEALSAKDDFVSNVSHEFWTPLTSILGHLDLVLEYEAQFPPVVVEHLAVARRNSERLYALVSDLLTTASASKSVHLRPTDLTGLVETSIQSAQPHAAGTGVKLSSEVPSMLWTSSDPLRIRQVLDNLISNAIKYSPDGGTVTVRATEQLDSALLEVQDTGMGMTQTETNQIFGKFFRTAAARESDIPGVGLGLSITKAIVDSHGGTIRCTSAVGAGTTFTVTLPLHTAAESSRN
ncbi:PAS domain-containing sensor histidine kinase [Arthrobacter sp. H5]|uniref:sensor histidine kinase n=1 Tax=Arthrobacter sp. H5 TaxID=1267973 RepID=UPI0004814A3E|nr:PAS domain-containing sensor histidine kinase [Arthrobacter sp. H5]